MTIHGECKGGQISAEYVVWAAMMRRCYNPNCKDYPTYGGRGVSVCDRWRFGENGKVAAACFIEDMGRRPSPRHSLDRTDNDGIYEPSNCRWATASQQAYNRRSAENKSGVRGAYPSSYRNKLYGYMSKIGGGKRRSIYFGTFDTAEQAAVMSACMREVYRALDGER